MVEEFFWGIAHDKNMSAFVDFYERNHVVMKEHDFFSKMGITHEKKIESEYLTDRKLDSDDFVFPLFTSYKQASLD